MKLLIFSDIHGSKSALERVMAIDADYYFADGDLANWGRGLDQLGPVMQKRAERMYVRGGPPATSVVGAGPFVDSFFPPHFFESDVGGTRKQSSPSAHDDEGRAKTFPRSGRDRVPPSTVDGPARKSIVP